MGRKSKAQFDYLKLAESKGLEFLGSAPSYVTDKVGWRCLRCQRIMQKSYRTTQRSAGCQCRSKTLTVSHYENLAEELNLLWEGPHLPKNTKEKTRWYSMKSDCRFEASYHELAYRTTIPKRLEEHLYAT